MDPVATAIEQHELVRALRGSFYVYPVVSALHVLGIGFLVSTVLLMDLRLLGAFRAVPEAPFVGVLRGAAFLGFALTVVTGLALFSVRATEYVALPLFWVKMGLIALAGLNLMGLLLARRGKALFGAASFTLWLAVLLAGRFLGFVYAT